MTEASIPTIHHAHGDCDQSVDELGAEMPGEGTEAVKILERRGVQIAGCDPHRVPAERILFDAELPADEAHDPLRNDLTTTQEPARVA
jgi:hypothetical protein